jgi:S-methylmethionine-dependent homocysteine/selenocysteine methylase
LLAKWRCARDEAGKAEVQIAASIPPQYSYRPDIEIDFDEMRNDYEEMVALLEPYVDLFLCETMTDAREARAATQACAKTDKPVWCAWTFKDDASGLLRSEDSVQDSIQDMHDIEIDAFLANCCAPESVSEVMPQMKKAIDLLNNGRNAHNGGDRAQDILFGGYANGFTPIPPKWKPGKIAELGVRRNLSPEIYADFAMEWVKSGARIIGGCCEISPAHIQAVYHALGR